MIIYKVTCLETNKIYIGKTAQGLQKRKWHHLWDSRHGSNLPFHRAIKKYGENAFVWEVLDEVMFSDLLLDLEKFYIKKYNTLVPNGYNLMFGGDNNVGYKHSAETRAKISAANKLIGNNKLGTHLSDETKKKISESHKGAKNYNFGKHLSGDHRKKIGLSNIGRRHSEEAKQKMRGRKMSDETKQKLREANTGRIRTDEMKRKMSLAHLGKSNPHPGYPHSEEQKRKVSESVRAAWRKRLNVREALN